MVKNLITAGQALRRITSREVSPIYCFFGEDSFFQEIIIDGILNVFKGEKTSLVLGVDDEEKILNHLNMTSLFSTKEVIIIRNPKKISVKHHDDIRDYCKSPSSNKVVIFVYEDPYASNKFIDSIASYSTSIDIRVPFPNKMREWISYYIKRKKINLSNNIIHELIENYGDNTKNVINEIDKLHILSMGKEGEETQSINSNYYKKNNQLWKLLDSVGKKNIKESIDIYKTLYNSNTPLIRVILNLLDFFREVINYKLKNNSGKFIRNKILLKNLNIYGNQYSMDDILYGIRVLRDCDLVNKTTSLDEQYLVNSILVDICKGANVKI